MNQRSDVLRYAAFATTPGGGNPAGVVLDATRLDDEQMQVIAAEVGYAETVFVTEAALRETHAETVCGTSPRLPRCRFAAMPPLPWLSRCRSYTVQEPLCSIPR